MTMTIKQSSAIGPQTLTKASDEWRTRPADQRYETLDALLAATRAHKASAVNGRGKLSDFSVGLYDDGELFVEGKSGARAKPTHWAFGQLCARASAPAGYIRDLPSELAAKCVNHGLRATKADDTEGSFLLRRGSGDALTLCAATSNKYVRVWNHEIAETLVDLQNVQPSWQFPEPFRKAGQRSGETGARGMAAQKQVPVAFASDHDMFAFMVDYDRPIDLDGTLLSRGFFIENSEVGARAVKLTTFLFDYVCSNIMVWGARNVCEISLSHVGRIRDRVLRADSEVLHTLTAYTDLAASEQVQQIRSAQRKTLGKDKAEVVATVYKNRSLGLSRATLDAAYTVASETPRYGDPRSVWAMVNGLTEVSQRAGFADERAKVDRAAGEVLTMAF